MNLERALFRHILEDISRKEIGILIGPRQAGKTTLLKKAAKSCKTRKLKYSYFDLEMPADASFFARDFQDILRDIGKEKQVIFIDEYHYLPNATKLFKTVYDGFKGTKIYASGSSALEMHKHLKESLAGRRRLYRIFPLSFSEWLPGKSKRLRLPDGIRDTVQSAAHHRLRNYLEEFIIFGGMPGLVHVTTEESKKRLLIDLVATYIQKDIKALLREEDILSFNRLLTLLAAQEGALLSENNFSQTLNYSLRQVRKDLAILDQMFLLHILKPYFTNRGRELKQTHKIYFFDTGLRNAVLRDFRGLKSRPDKGALMEAFVFHEMQKNLRVSQDIYYWRTREKDEVDFILVQDRIPLAVEVKSHLTRPEIPRGVQRFFKMYPECPMAVVFNDALFHDLMFHGKRIVFAPHYYASLLPGVFER